eukprot:1331975-Pleurochrysis_carterae.AAC.1
MTRRDVERDASTQARAAGPAETCVRRLRNEHACEQADAHAVTCAWAGLAGLPASEEAFGFKSAKTRSSAQACTSPKIAQTEHDANNAKVN